MTLKKAVGGSWKSPFSASLIAQKSISFGEISVEGENIYWLEGRPYEQGRNVVVHVDRTGKQSDLLSAPYNARTLVYSYGGGSYLIHQGTLYFSQFGAPNGEMPYARYRDQRMYRLTLGGTPEVLTDSLNVSYADATFDSSRNRLICVREDHQLQWHGESLATLVAIDLNQKRAQTLLVSGDDFYTSPRLSPDGKQLCWLSWNYPQMPWDGTQLWLADINEKGMLENKRLIAGGTEESILQPEWSQEGKLYFLSDRTNWWNLYHYEKGQVHPIYIAPYDFGGPPWLMRMSHYALISEEKIICTFAQEGQWKLALLNLNSSHLEILSEEFTEIRQLRAGKNFVVFCGGNPESLYSIVKWDLSTREKTILKVANDLDLKPLQEYISKPVPIAFQTGNEETAYAFYYAPQNPEYRLLDQEKPPLLLQCHGGPTGATSTELDLEIQYFTSRGFAVIDVNYRGSIGYGRKFRQSLYSHWGVYDVEDCEFVVKFLKEKGWIDERRIFARGGSAGGYTTLCLLAFRDFCKAGVSYFGISNLELIAQHSDKLEAHYPDRLIGPYPQAIEIYRQRSPLFHADKIKAPVLFFQGMEDPVVPPEQTEMMVASLEERKIAHTAFYFPNEQHGFRMAENIQKALESEYAFYVQLLRIIPEEKIKAIEIKHWAKVPKKKEKKVSI